MVVLHIPLSFDTKSTGMKVKSISRLNIMTMAELALEGLLPVLLDSNGSNRDSADFLNSIQYWLALVRGGGGSGLKTLGRVGNKYITMCSESFVNSPPIY